MPIRPSSLAGLPNGVNGRSDRLPQESMLAAAYYALAAFNSNVSSCDCVWLFNEQPYLGEPFVDRVLAPNAVDVALVGKSGCTVAAILGILVDKDAGFSQLVVGAPVVDAQHLWLGNRAELDV